MYLLIPPLLLSLQDRQSSISPFLSPLGQLISVRLWCRFARYFSKPIPVYSEVWKDLVKSHRVSFLRKPLLFPFLLLYDRRQVAATSEYARDSDCLVFIYTEAEPSFDLMNARVSENLGFCRFPEGCEMNTCPTNAREGSPIFTICSYTPSSRFVCVTGLFGWIKGYDTLNPVAKIILSTSVTTSPSENSTLTLPLVGEAETRFS